MTIQADIFTALTGVADDNVFPEAVPEDFASVLPLPPFVIVIKTGREPLNLLDGTADLSKYGFVFECYAERKADALALAAAVRVALRACLQTTLPTQFEVPVSAEDFEPAVAEFMEPVAFDFWAA